MTTLRVYLNVQEKDSLELTIGEYSIEFVADNIPEDLQYKIDSLNDTIAYLRRDNEDYRARYTKLFDAFTEYRQKYGPPESDLKAIAIPHIKAGNWINAIKEVRANSGLGLKEAKDLVDKWRGEFLAETTVPAMASEQ